MFEWYEHLENLNLRADDSSAAHIFERKASNIIQSEGFIMIISRLIRTFTQFQQNAARSPDIHYASETTTWNLCDKKRRKDASCDSSWGIISFPNSTHSRIMEILMIKQTYTCKHESRLTSTHFKGNVQLSFLHSR